MLTILPWPKRRYDRATKQEVLTGEVIPGMFLATYAGEHECGGACPLETASRTLWFARQAITDLVAVRAECQP
jgi:hypothetical protein